MMWRLVSPVTGRPVGFASGTRAEALAAAQRLSNRTGTRLKMLPNPQPTPRVGEIWRGLKGDRCRIVSVSGKRVTVLQLDTGHRVTSDLADFLATYRAPATARPNPKRKGRKVNARSRGEVDQDAARELELFIENDADLYRQQHIPILKNLWRKMVKGTYDHEKAVKLWMYLVVNGGKKYAREFSSSERDWSGMFNIPTREVVARSLAETGLLALENREYDWQGPKSNPPRTPRRQRRAVASGRFAKARHHAQAQVGRGVRRLDLQRRAAFGVGRNPRTQPGPVAGGLFRLNNGSIVLARQDDPSSPMHWIIKSQAERYLHGGAVDPNKFVLYKPAGGRMIYLQHAGNFSNPGGRFTRQVATIARIAEHYYVLRAPGIVDIGGRVRAPLTAWARTHGFAPTYVDERKPDLRATPFPNPKGRNLSVPERHQLKIARDTLKMSDVGARVMGGPTKAEAREIIWRLTGREPVENRRQRRLKRPLRAAGVRGKGRSNPRESEVVRARRTFRRLNEIEPGRESRVRTTRGAPRVLAKLGELVSLTYRSDKYAGTPENPHGKTQLYEHRTKRPRPVLATDPSGREVHIVGGRMHPTPDGLIN